MRQVHGDVQRNGSEDFVHNAQTFDAVTSPSRVDHKTYCELLNAHVACSGVQAVAQRGGNNGPMFSPACVVATGPHVGRRDSHRYGIGLDGSRCDGSDELHVLSDV
jgi:hypothetical protein